MLRHSALVNNSSLHKPHTKIQYCPCTWQGTLIRDLNSQDLCQGLSKKKRKTKVEWSKWNIAPRKHFIDICNYVPPPPPIDHRRCGMNGWRKNIYFAGQKMKKSQIARQYQIFYTYTISLSCIQIKHTFFKWSRCWNHWSSRNVWNGK